MEPLKLCPFCGGKARSEITVSDATAWCINCKARVVFRHSDRNFEDGLPRAVAAWNQRARADFMEIPDTPKSDLEKAQDENPNHL